MGVKDCKEEQSLTLPRLRGHVLVSMGFQWNEREESPREGVRERAWEGYLSVTVAPPTTTEAVERNPLGVFVTDLSWSPLAPTAGDAAPSDSDTEVEERPAQRETETPPVRRPVSAPPRRPAAAEAP